MPTAAASPRVQEAHRMTVVLMFMMPLMLAISSLYVLWTSSIDADASEMNGSDF